MAVALDTLAYSRKLREAGFSEQQADGQAEALAAAMTDSLATKQDLRELEASMSARFAQVDARFAQVDARFAQVDARIDHVERHFDTRLTELEMRFDSRLREQIATVHISLADLERRMTTRIGAVVVASVGVVSAIVALAA